MVPYVDAVVAVTDCDACNVVCVACVSAERVWWCEGDGNAGLGDG